MLLLNAFFSYSYHWSYANGTGVLGPKSLLLPSHCVASIVGLNPVTAPVVTLTQYKSLLPPSDRVKPPSSDEMLPFSAHSPNDGVCDRRTPGSGRLEGCRICCAYAFRHGLGWGYWNSGPYRLAFLCSSHAMADRVYFREHWQSPRTL